MKVVRLNTMNEFEVIENLGVAILKNELKTASIGLIYAMTPSYKAHAIQESIVFVGGTGLEILIQTFGIEVDATEFRETFFAWCNRRKRSVALSSATTSCD